VMIEQHGVRLGAVTTKPMQRGDDLLARCMSQQLCRTFTACEGAGVAALLAHAHARTLFFFSRPPMTLSMACSKCGMVTVASLARAATSAASLHTLAMSAPLKPGVRAARRSVRSTHTTAAAGAAGAAGADACRLLQLSRWQDQCRGPP
jgi:hypothetical protein